MANQKTEYNRKYHKNRYHKRCRLAMDRLGGICVECGTDEDLEFDHIDPSTKRFTITQEWSMPLEQWLVEVDKCQLLCKPHHLEKTIGEQKTRTHGTISMYRRERCRCDLCREVWNAYHRDLKRKNRAPIV